MSDGAVLYSPAPPNVPPDLTTPSTSYRLRVILVLTSLFVFGMLYLGLVAGSAYLCYSSFGPREAPRPIQPRGQKLLQDAFQTDQRLTQVYNNALQQWQQSENAAGQPLRERQIATTRFLRVLEDDVLQPWRAQRQLLARVQDLPGEELQLIEQCSRCFQLQEESWELLVQAIHHNDRQAAEQSQQKAQQSEQLVRQFSADAERFYRRHSPRTSERGGWDVIIGIVAGLLCLFLVKGFFKWRSAPKTQQLEITEQDQPQLFAFIRRLCQDTRAPLPHRVYLTPEVNAAVFYHESLMSLVLPTPKNLVIGLGLVNQLNLSEFKAVLAHEFGHFSQDSMKLGSYVYTANRVIGDLVHGRDWLDDGVAALCRFDVRIAIFAWLFSGVLWVLRKTLEGLFRVINFANTALLRQMEFNADLVAVSVTGSDALVNGLARLDFATDALNQAWNDLTTAADHQLYSRDLFYHQTQAITYLRGLRNNPRLGEPLELPADPCQATQVFQPEDTSVPRMWATHPSNHDRETNVKRRYIRSPIDERSPWLLFQNATALREEVTRRLYQLAGRSEGLALEAPEVVQVFIDEEHAETTYHPSYCGLYDHRYLKPGDLDEIIRAAPAEFTGSDQLAEAYARLYGDELKARMKAHCSRQEDYRRLAPLAQGTVALTGKDFQFRDGRRQAADVVQLLDQVKKELDQDFEWMAQLDRRAFLVHFAMARQIGEEALRKMEDRYRFHLAVQEIHSRVTAAKDLMQRIVGQLVGRRELTEKEYHGALALFQSAYDSLSESLQSAGQLSLPALKNLTPGEPLGPYLLKQPLNHPPVTLDGEWIGWFMEQLDEALAKAQRIHFKSLGGILALQEQLAEQWSALTPAPSGS